MERSALIAGASRQLRLQHLLNPFVETLPRPGSRNDLKRFSVLIIHWQRIALLIENAITWK